MKTLLLDIETAPNTAYVWGLFKETIPLQRLIESRYILCWASKWLGEGEVFFDSIQGKKDPRIMLSQIHAQLDEADTVIHYNGTSFDIPTLNKEFLTSGFDPPSPYKQIDLLRVVRQQFKFTSNKLDHVSKELELTNKVDHIGFELWVRCMQDDPSAWKQMKEYNIGDLYPLEELYYKIRPWIKNHPNYSLFSNGKIVCPNCGSDHLHSKGSGVTQGAVYQRYKCVDCGSPVRGIKNEGTRTTAYLA